MKKIIVLPWPLRYTLYFRFVLALSLIRDQGKFQGLFSSKENGFFLRPQYSIWSRDNHFHLVSLKTASVLSSIPHICQLKSDLFDRHDFVGGWTECPMPGMPIAEMDPYDQPSATPKFIDA